MCVCVCVCVCVCISWASPSDAEADRAHVGEDVIEQVIASSSGLQVDIELGELQLDVIDVMEEQHQNPYVVVSAQQKTYSIVCVYQSFTSRCLSKQQSL